MPGAIHHVFARGNNKDDIYLDDADRRCYLALLAEAIQRSRWRCLMYCLMPNHVHLLVETPEPNLGKGMQRFHGDYATAFNRAHRRCGHVFQGRYGSKLVEDDAQLWMTAAYVARNPVEAALCRRPRDWCWSSHAAVLDGTAPAWLDVGRLLELFSSAGGDPRERYAEFATPA